ncbi:MAG: chaperone modulator CbpM [Methylococcaceae bacterium]|nr:chaperone modulator CbpM [Methylococcaceae bacterium]
MQIEQTEGLWLYEHYEFSLAELADLSGMPETELREWVDEGVLVPIDPEAAQWSFGADRLVTVRLACRLRKDFDLEPHSVALLVMLLDRVHELEAEVRDLGAKLPRVLR